MKRVSNRVEQKDELSSEYDFTALRPAPAEKSPRLSPSKSNMFVLEPDLAFPDNESVNQALRILIKESHGVPLKKTRAKLPEMNPVKSSSIRAIGYDVEERSLFVQFVTGSVYVYRNLDPETFRNFLASKDKGYFFNQNIKPRSLGAHRIL